MFFCVRDCTDDPVLVCFLVCFISHYRFATRSPVGMVFRSSHGSIPLKPGERSRTQTQEAVAATLQAGIACVSLPRKEDRGTGQTRPMQAVALRNRTKNRKWKGVMKIYFRQNQNLMIFGCWSKTMEIVKPVGCLWGYGGTWQGIQFAAHVTVLDFQQVNVSSFDVMPLSKLISKLHSIIWI